MEFRYRCDGCEPEQVEELRHITDDDHAREITYETFRHRVGYDQVRRWEKNYRYNEIPGLRLGNDRCVSFYASRTPEGKRAYFFIWSAYDHIYY